MITNDVSTCPKCGGDLKYYDRVTRIVRTKGRKTWKIPMRRLQCTRYILRGVTEGLSYNALKMQYAIPCCREVYYNLYRRFFWLLSKERD